MASSGIRWPNGKRFAFTVFDDTDLANSENVPPVYEFLAELGFRTTKSVWPISGDLNRALHPGATCEDDDYRRWLLQLKDRGFEIGFHGATYHTSSREETIRGLERFQAIFGHDPITYASHAGNQEGMYWGEARLTGVNSLLFTILTRFRRWRRWRGHRKEDPLFWGDVCQQRIKYVRNFVFSEIDTLQACPYMPYHDPERPYANYWFASAEGANVESFNRTLRSENQDTLLRQGGACIMYTHFANGFYRKGRLDDTFRRQMTDLADRDGWFVPVAELLDFLLQQRDRHEVSRAERGRLERRWLWHKLKVGTT